MAASSGREDLEVTRVSTQSELTQLRGPWDELHAQTPTATVLLTWDWIHTWWNHYQADGELWVLLVKDSSGTIRGIAPWMLRDRRFGALMPRRVKTVFYRPPAHQDVLARPSDERAVCKAIADHLASRSSEWDLLELRGLPESSPLPEVLAAASGRLRHREPILCPYVELPADWDTYVNTRLSANRRQQVRRHRRRLEKDFPDRVAYRRVDRAADVAEAMETLFEFSRVKWRDRDGASAFDDARFRAFHREVAPIAFEKGWLRFYQLVVDDEIISVRYCFADRGVFIDYQLAFDPSWATYRPGELLFAHVLQEAIRESAHELDFLSGAYRWKMSWATSVRSERVIEYAGATLPGRTWLLAADAVEGTKRWARTFVPEPMRNRMNLYLSGLKARASAGSRADGP